MGCDIHGVFQRFDGSEWQDIASKYEQSSHYQLFAVLAGVRNGHGFDRDGYARVHAGASE